MPNFDEIKLALILWKKKIKKFRKTFKRICRNSEKNGMLVKKIIIHSKKERNLISKLRLNNKNMQNQ